MAINSQRVGLFLAEGSLGFLRLPHVGRDIDTLDDVAGVVCLELHLVALLALDDFELHAVGVRVIH